MKRSIIKTGLLFLLILITIMTMISTSSVSVQAGIGDVVHSIPHPGPWGHGLTWDGMYIWSSDYENNLLYQLDPISGTVIHTLTAPGPDPQGLTWDGQYLWYADSYWSNPENNFIAQLDPVTGTVLNSFPAPGSSPMGLAWDGEYLWNADWNEFTIYKLNPSDGSVIKSFLAPGTCPYGLTWDGKFLWVSDWCTDQIYKLDPADGSVILSFSSPGDYAFDLAFDGQFLWNLDYPSTIYQIDIEYSSEPIPDIKANGSDDPVIINQGDNLTVSIALDPGSLDGDNADWWILLFYFNPGTGSFTPIPLVDFQAPLFNMTAFDLLNTTSFPQGTFVFFYGVDMDPNGLFDPAQLYSDLVVVTVQ